MHTNTTQKYQLLKLENKKINIFHFINIKDIYADDTTLMEESKELKSLLMKVKEESEKCLA